MGQRAAADSPFTLDVWSTADGLPQSSVIALTQTRDGYLWLGTLNGLVRFDGNSMTPFNVNNTPACPTTALFFCSRTAGPTFGSARKAGRCARFKTAWSEMSSPASGKFYIAYEDEAGAVWFCFADGRILRWSSGEMEIRPPVSKAFWDQLFERAFHLVVPQKNRGFWSLNVQNLRVEKVNGDQSADDGAFPWTPAPVGYLLPAVKASIVFDSAVVATCSDRDGNLVVGTHGQGIFWMDGHGGWRHIALGEKPSQNFVLSRLF